MAELAKLKNIRGGHKSVVTKLIRKVETNNGGTSADSTVLHDTRTILQGLTNQILDILTNPDEVSAEVIAHSEFDHKILTCLEKIGSTSDASAKEKCVRLPKLQIKRFSGLTRDWFAFWELFNNSIHKNTSLSEIEKFSYLLSYLEGQALKSVQGLTVTSSNYSVAVDTLKERFGNTQSLVNGCMNRLFQLKPVTNTELKALRSFYDYVNIQIRSLESLKVPLESYDSLLLPLMLSKLPESIKLKLANSCEDNAWTFKQLMKLLLREINSREKCLIGTESNFENWRAKTSSNCSNFNNRSNNSMRFSKPQFQPPTHNSTLLPNTLNTYFSRQENKDLCAFCGLTHPSQNCKKINLIEDRKNAIRSKGLCFVCLARNHRSNQCSGKCSYCSGKHHVSICYKTQNRNVDNETSASNQHIIAQAAVNTNSHILLQTAKTYCYGQNRNGRMINILFDKGSQRSYVTDKLANDLNLSVLSEEKCRIKTFASSEALQLVTKVVEVKLASKNSVVKLNALTIPAICEGLNQSIVGNTNGNLQSIDCSNANIEGQIDMLIGCDNYWDLVTGEIINKFDGPVAMNSHFGWLISGRNFTPRADSIHTFLCKDCQFEPIIVEEDEQRHVDSLHQDPVEEIDETIALFEDNIGYDGKRYEVQLPWRSSFALKNNNFSLAYSRLKTLQRKLKTCKQSEEYGNIIENYLEKGYIEKIVDWQVPCCYLPHHGVIKEDKETTKLRIVFDGSAKVGTSLSLNECLYKGPSLVSNLVSQLLRFRMSKFIIVADIQEAFLQVKLAESDRNFTRFLWFEEHGEICGFRFKRVPFGLSCSPFLLNATVQHHLKKHAPKYLNAFYVDDLILQANSEHDGIQDITTVKEVMLRGGFHLRKWTSNCQTLNEELKFPAVDTKKVLGIEWNLKSDTISILMSKSLKNEEVNGISKRYVLSFLSTVFDPLGLFSCVSVRMRILFQDICKLGIDWSDTINSEHLKNFLQLAKELEEIKSVEVKRWVFPMFNPNSEFEIHVFADASKRAYGACMYIVYNNDGKWFSHLLRSKVKVVPIRGSTIPKLELLAATIAAKLYETTISAFIEWKIVRVAFWTDSMAVLNWITGSKQWPAFVENRVSHLRKLDICEKWNYIATQQNPADILSRGASTESMSKNGLWWNGPKFLRREAPMPEKRIIQEGVFLNVSTFAAVTEDNGQIINVNLFSSYTRLCRTVAYVLRFIRNLKYKNKQIFERGPLLTEEIIRAEACIIKQEQLKYFAAELKMLKEKKFHKDSIVCKLQVTIDDEGILRVGTRLAAAQLLNCEVSPILLSNKSYVTKLIVMKCHITGMHCGVQQTVNNLRTRFWITKARQIVKTILRKCISCKRVNGKPFSLPAEPQLPSFRVEKTLPFINVGIDYAGPMLVRTNLSARNSKFMKIYVCVFTCAVTRAVHFEVSIDLTHDSFVNIFRRFISRRGLPAVIYTDNGKTFVAASKSIASIINGSNNDNPVMDFCSQHQIHWKFIVPKAAWWGGFYERIVGLMKTSMKKVMGNAMLSYFEFETLVIEIEGTLNNRPLTYVSSDCSDLDSSAITPSQLLLGRQGNDNSCSADLESNYRTTIKRLKFQSLLVNQYWKLFYKQYLLGLREHYTKSQRHSAYEIAVGEVVHIYDQGPRSRWRLALVSNLIKGRDGRIRAATVRLPVNGQHHIKLTRPINHLFPLEVRSSVKVEAEINDKNDEEKDFQ